MKKALFRVLLGATTLGAFFIVPNAVRASAIQVFVYASTTPDYVCIIPSQGLSASTFQQLKSFNGTTFTSADFSQYGIGGSGGNFLADNYCYQASPITSGTYNGSVYYAFGFSGAGPTWTPTYYFTYTWNGGITGGLGGIYIPPLLWVGGVAPPNLIFNASSTVDITSAFTSGGLSTTSLQSFCDANMPFDNSSIINATLTAIPNGICRATTYLIIPSSDSLNQFATLASSTKNRFPFSYFNSVFTVWNSLTASSTLNSPTFAYDLADLGLGSTTPMGNILPNLTVLSSTTVQSYFPSGTFSLLKALAGIAIILVLIGDIFFSTKRMMK